MANQVVKTGCGTCDHELVHGVACDGQYEECPYVKLRTGRRLKARPHLYLVEVADLALPGEYDAVRGES